MIVVHVALTVLCAVLGILQLLEKGPVLSRAYLFATKAERAAMDKKPRYRRSGIIFLIMTVFFALSIAYVLQPNRWLVLAMGGVAIAALIYGTVAGLMIEKRSE